MQVARAGQGTYGGDRERHFRGEPDTGFGNSPGGILFRHRIMSAKQQR